MKRFVVFVPVILAAALETGCATSAMAGHPATSTRSETRATRILDRHRAREFPGGVGKALGQAGRKPVEFRVGVAVAERDGSRPREVLKRPDWLLEVDNSLR